MRIDTAVRLAREKYTPEVLWRILHRNRFDGALVTAADAAGADWLMETAEAHPWILGVMACGEKINAAGLDAWCRSPVCKGVWLRSAAVTEQWLDELAMRELAVDLVLHPHELPGVRGLAQRWPSLRLAVAPLGEDFAEWTRAIEEIAADSRIMVKVTGMIHRADAARPYVRRLMQVLGPERLMFGSDWPRCAEAGTWKQSLAAFTQALGAQTMETRELILGENARRHYRLANDGD